MNLLWQQKLCNLQQLKIAVFTYRSPHFCFPWGRPWGNHAKCCMNGKRIRCLQIASLHVPSNYNRFWDTARYLWKKSLFYHTPLHWTPVRGGSRRNIGTPFGMEKLEWCRYPMVKKFRRYLYSFWRDPRTWQTDGQTNTASQHTALMHTHCAVKKRYPRISGLRCINWKFQRLSTTTMMISSGNPWLRTV